MKGEILSKRAWEEGVRKGIWGTAFHYWFPLIINNKFNVLNELKSCIANANRAPWRPELILTTIPQIMAKYINP